MSRMDYNHFTFCVNCQITNPLIRRTCEQCGKLVRHKHRCYKPKVTRYGIAFIPTAIIVCSNLYNTGFI